VMRAEPGDEGSLLVTAMKGPCLKSRVVVEPRDRLKKKMSEGR